MAGHLGRLLRMQTPIQDARAVPARHSGAASPLRRAAAEATDAEWAVTLVREAVAVLFAPPAGARLGGGAGANAGRPGLSDRGGRGSQATQPAVR